MVRIIMYNVLVSFLAKKVSERLLNFVKGLSIAVFAFPSAFFVFIVVLFISGGTIFPPDVPSSVPISNTPYTVAGAIAFFTFSLQFVHGIFVMFRKSVKD